MAPMNKSPKSGIKKKSRNKSVMDIAQKMKILELLESGEIIAAVARRFVVNESTIRSIKKNKDKIKASAGKLGPHAEFCKITRAIIRIKSYEELYRDMSRRAKQTAVTDFF